MPGQLLEKHVVKYALGNWKKAFKQRIIKFFNCAAFLEKKEPSEYSNELANRFWLEDLSVWVPRMAPAVDSLILHRSLIQAIVT